MAIGKPKGGPGAVIDGGLVVKPKIIRIRIYAKPSIIYRASVFFNKHKSLSGIWIANIAHFGVLLIGSSRRRGKVRRIYIIAIHILRPLKKAV
jgi:hypothetical protein